MTRLALASARWPGRAAREVRLLVACAAAAGCAADNGTTAPLAAPHGARALAATPAATPAAVTDNAVLLWSDALLGAVRALKPSPPVSARALAILHTAMFDAWAAYDDVAVGTQYGGALRRPVAERTAANKQRAVSYAAYRALVDLFPAQTPAFATLLTSLGYDPSDATQDLASAAGVGNVAAAAVLAARHHDGSNQLGDLHAGAYSDYTGYVPVNTADVVVDPNRWQPLRVPNGNGGFVVQAFINPQWSRVTPFALTSASQFRPAELRDQYPFGGYMKQVEELIRLSAQLDDETKTIAEYWADGPNSELPPGHWCLFAAYVSRRDGHTLDDDVKMFFGLGNAMLDASIAAWDAKRFYDSVRPISAIHYAKAGKPIRAWGGVGRGTVLMRGEEWQPYQAATFVTPAFPEFVSGHSTFSAAAAAILRRVSGSDVLGASVTVPAGSSRIEPGVPSRPVTLSWPTFTAAADEAGLSRRYGGIHFESGDLAGRAMGRQIGEQVWAKVQSYVAGTAAPALLATAR